MRIFQVPRDIQVLIIEADFRAGSWLGNCGCRDIDEVLGPFDTGFVPEGLVDVSVDLRRRGLSSKCDILAGVVIVDDLFARR